jgi:hypothetical protein
MHRQRQAESGAANVMGIALAGVLLGLLQQRQQLAGQALGRLLAQGQGFHQHGQLVFQPAPQPGGQRVLGADRPGACGKCPAQGQVRFVLRRESRAGVIQFRQTVEQLLQGIAHLPAFLNSSRVSRLARCSSHKLLQARPVWSAAAWQWASNSGASKRARLSSSWSLIQRRALAGIADTGIVHGHFQALGIAVAANRQLRAGQTQQRPGRVHRRTPN